MSHPLSITACYAFVHLGEQELKTLQQELRCFGRERGMEGLVLLATEGINATVSGTASVIEEWKAHLQTLFGEMPFKDSFAAKSVFRRWSVKIKAEIVALKDHSVRPAGKHKHVSPEQWQEMLEREDVILVDARNTYETAIGKFRGAVDPGIRSFHEFPTFAKTASLPKNKKILMYCTGGIRCEKAIFTLEEAGYDNVYQLDGGILAYLEKFPCRDFEGECFVFDHRVAVDQDLQPSSTYELCPHCGDPGHRPISCTKCGQQRKICDACLPKEASSSCSKRCRNELLARTSAVA